jgi:ABC-type lipoprotein release transport system permease subunit
MKTVGAVRPRRASPRLLLFLAWKALGENRLSLLLLLLAVAAGVAFQVPNRANLAGYRAELMQQEVSSGMGHVRVRPKRGERFPDVTDMLAGIRNIPGVDSVEPVLSLPGAIRKGGRFVVVGVTGIEPTGARKPYQRTAGADLARGDRRGVLLGERLARRLGATVGDEVELQVLLASRPRLLLDDQGVGSYTLEVRGLVGLHAIDAAFVDWSFLAAETGDERGASLLLVRASGASLDDCRRIAAAIERAFPSATALSWLDDSRYLRSTVRALQAIESIAGGMSLFGVSIPVLALLYIDALHRRRQVSLLSAVGYHGSEIFWIFFAKALIVGVAGVLLGALFGWSIVRYFMAYPIYSYEDLVIRPALDARNLLWPMLMVLATTVIAGSVPAWQAARVDPSDTLRRIE